MSKERKSVLEKIIRVTAEMTGETASWLGFYEAKLPEELIRKTEGKEKE